MFCCSGCYDTDKKRSKDINTQSDGGKAVLMDGDESQKITKNGAGGAAHSDKKTV